MKRSAISLLLSVAVFVTGFEQPLFSQSLLPAYLERQQVVPAPDLTSLKIVVVSGEDGVNIVKRKTAVQPVVEVRDKNNTPVSGVIVNFTTPSNGPSAVFSNGSRTLSMVTDANGRVAVTGMQPVSNGDFKITVTASLAGEVLATATIAQTNFAVAAAAAAAGASTGGLSTGVIIGIVVGVAAAAALGGILALHSGGSSSTASTPTATIGLGSGGTVGAPH